MTSPATIIGRARGAPASPFVSRSQSRPADENRSYSPNTVEALVSAIEDIDYSLVEAFRVRSTVGNVIVALY